MTSRKRVSSEAEDFATKNGENDDTAQQRKKLKSKSTETASSRPSGKKGAAGAKTSKTDTNGDPYWQVSRQRRVTVSTFKGRTLVNVREYYEKDGQELPGKKGISMPLDQFNALVELLPDIEHVVREKGGVMVRPEYADASANGKEESSAQDDAEQDDEEDENEPATDNRRGSKRNGSKGSPVSPAKNIEATSDEDEGD